MAKRRRRKKRLLPWYIMPSIIMSALAALSLAIYVTIPIEFLEEFRFYFLLSAIGLIILVLGTLVIGSALIRKFIKGMFKTPYYVGKGTYSAGEKAAALNKTVRNKKQGRRTRKKRAAITAKYDSFQVLETQQGSLDSWEKRLFESDSTIGIIVGARGSGKSAIGIKVLENIYAKSRRACYAMGFQEQEMPSWIRVVENVSELQNDSTVLIDEGGIMFSARRSMSDINKMISDLILIARHKNISILFITQNSSNLDVNIIRQADFLVLKPSSLLQMDFERKKIQDIYKAVARHFEKHKDKAGAAYIYSEEFRGFIENPLPSFWTMRMSKSFAGDKGK